MEKIIFYQFNFMLSVLSCVRSESELYYIRPTYPENVVCPRNPCQYLNYFDKELAVPKPPVSYEFDTVTMILIEGRHTIRGSAYNFGSPANSRNLHIIGHGKRSNNVTIEELETSITVMDMTLESFTAMKIYLYIDESVVDSQITNISILNCAFVGSSMILTNVHLTIKDSSFTESTSTAITLFCSTLTIVGHVKFYKNMGFQGGALMLIGTVIQIAREAKLLFRDNNAEKTGGAIFVVHSQLTINTHGYYSPCFYQLLDYNNDSTYSINFINNSAAKGGDHIYGASLKSGCSLTNDLDNYDVFHKVFLLDPGYNSSLSAVSADATRVCICDVNGKPQCKMDIMSYHVYPGEQFSLDLVVVGGDYGTTIGTVYASFSLQNSTSTLCSNYQHQTIIKNTECSRLNFSVYSDMDGDVLFLLAQETQLNRVENYITYIYDNNDNMSDEYYYEEVTDFFYDTDIKLRHTPLFINIDFLPCPPGFVLFGDPPGCQCHPVLTANGVNCILNYLNCYHKWNSTNTWIQVDNDALQISTHCPFRYCKPSRKNIKLNSSDTQCAVHRAGILCGGCKQKYSLAIGSSHCIHCPNNNHVSLLIFFAVAGVLLILGIAALNLTVTQGMINSLVVYANIIWAYQDILFPTGFGKALIAHKIFIAWLNLDFGIETCFFRGMNSYSKAWLQFVFPIYTAGLFLLGLRYSSKLSTLFESRSTSTLATLLFLSYSKLLRAIIACLQLVTYYTYNDSNVDRSTNIVWAIDGNYSYGRHPHIFLLLAAIACFVLLWLPYTLLLFLMQWLRSVDHLGPLKFIGRYKPLYDAYFAPLRDKHHYWFGLLLLSQGLLLLVSSLTLYILPEISVILLLAISVFLLCYVNSVRPYKQMSVALFESSVMINFIALTVGYLYFRNNNKGMTILLSLSISAALVEFCGIVIWNLIPKKVIERFRVKIQRNVELDSDDVHILEEYHSESEYVGYHDSQSIKLANVIAEKAT